MHSPPVSSRAYVGLGVLILIGVFFRFYNLDKKLFWMDEAASTLRIAGYSQADLRAQMRHQKVWSAAELDKFQQVPRDFAIGDALRVMSHDAPQHTPLFYLLLRLWAGAFGDSVGTLRALPALLSLLAFPALWFLCRELFFDDPGRERIAFVALALLAISPLHVLYAQEARQYSLLVALFLASSGLLFRALRVGQWRCWMFYTLCLALGFYTHLLFVLMWLAHASIVVLWFWQQRKSTREDAIAKTPVPILLAFSAATALAVLLFMPWIIILWQGRAQTEQTTTWMMRSSSPFYVVKTWILVWSNLFFDPAETGQWSASVRAWAGLALAARVVRVVVAGAMVWSLGFVWRKAPRRVACAVILLAVVPFVVMAAPDLLVGGYRSTIARYVMAAYIGLQLAVAYWVAAQLGAPSTRRRSAVIFGLLIFAGIGSCALSSQATLWWNKTSSIDIPQVARALNACDHPLLVTSLNHNTFSLERLLKPSVRFYFVTDDRNFDPQQIASLHADALFFYKPSAGLRATLQQRGMPLKKDANSNFLWRLTDTPVLNR